ncbi:MAG: alpha-galactosidase [Planctomycetes bacterium]|nr:alpha-galactosidase [Planctomycetota bacterium]
MSRLAVPFLVAVATPLPILAQQVDWLLDPSPYVAEVRQEQGQVVLDNGLLRLRIELQPLALVSLENLVSDQQLLRAPASLGAFVLGGRECELGGAEAPFDRAFLPPMRGMPADPDTLPFVGWQGPRPIAERLAWGRTRDAAPDAVWPPKGVQVQFTLRDDSVEVTVHVELYDGLPLIGHWFELKNLTEAPLGLETFTSLRLPVVEAESRVEPERLGVRLPNLYVETDYSFHAMTGADGSSHCVRWLPDPSYETQVNYQKQTLCLLEVKPDVGPAQTVAPGAKFTTFHTWVLAPDREDRQRQSMAQRRMYRVLAPWSTENPLMMHVRSAEPAAVKLAIDQCVEVGFEMVILTFGSGFDVEDDSQENLDRWKAMAEYAHRRGIQIGGYSLLSSRKIEPETDNCINVDTGKPGGQVFGHAPALASAWGQRYFAKLRRFYEYTGFDLLEHDGSYPGDFDAMARPPLQKGYADSRWVQFGIIRDFYRWCRARGIYLNVPDWYFLQGSSKTGMGYRETNWSLPRDLQVLHARQNLFDGTREKNASMGWMFVPLTEYHGGGAAATIEPLAEHLGHYGRMLASNLGYGAQACWRGPRLYDTPLTRDLVERQVAWFKRYRHILQADVIHTSSRRADGRDLDWVLHADPFCDPPAMLVVYNPLGEPRKRTIRLDLYHAGLVGEAVAHEVSGDKVRVPLDRLSRGELQVEVPAGECVWYALRPR